MSYGVKIMSDIKLYNADCMNTNKNFIGIELDDKYFDIAQNRIKNCTYINEHLFD